MQKGSVTEIAPRITQFWSERKATFHRYALSEGDVSPDVLLVYLQRRVRRQLGWFSDSAARLDYIAERRKLLLLGFYCAAAAVACIKLIIFLCCGQPSPYLLASLLIMTGLSAAMTAYYINQNARSLVHRYHTQQRWISQWLETFNGRWPFAELPSKSLDMAAKNEVRGAVLEFERLMVEELIDWIQITTHDAIELGP